MKTIIDLQKYQQIENFIEGKKCYNNKGMKPCPKCLTMIEKKSGCNQMTCLCGHKWCWMCGADCPSENENIVPHFFCNQICKHSFDSSEDLRNTTDGSYCGIMNGDFKKYRTVAEIVEKITKKNNMKENNSIVEYFSECCNICCDICKEYFNDL